jgi:hypothetical protein
VRPSSQQQQKILVLAAVTKDAAACHLLVSANKGFQPLTSAHLNFRKCLSLPSMRVIPRSSCCGWYSLYHPRQGV